MRWPVNAVVLSLVLGMSLGLYRLESQVQTLERRLSVTAVQLEGNRRNSRVLVAEWSFLSQPSRVQALAQRHLALRPVAPAQVVSMASLPRNLVGLGATDKSPNNGNGGETFRHHDLERPSGPPIPRRKPNKPRHGERIILASRVGQP